MVALQIKLAYNVFSCHLKNVLNSRAFPYKMQFFLPALGRHELHVHPLAQNPTSHGCYGTFCNQRFLCLPPLLGHLT